jgi:hypothetical protein
LNPLKLTAASAFAPDLKNQVLSSILKQKIGDLLPSRRFQVIQALSRLSHRHDEEILTQASTNFIN